MRSRNVSGSACWTYPQSCKILPQTITSITPADVGTTQPMPYQPSHQWRPACRRHPRAVFKSWRRSVAALSPLLANLSVCCFLGYINSGGSRWTPRPLAFFSNEPQEKRLQPQPEQLPSPGMFDRCGWCHQRDALIAFA